MIVMKEFKRPLMEVIEFDKNDVTTTSIGCPAQQCCTGHICDDCDFCDKGSSGYCAVYWYV